MYSHKRYSIRIRDGVGRYGDDPGPAEEHPGAQALQDLPGAAVHHIPLIVARYAAVRAWSLHFQSAPAVVVEHATSAATAHLQATGSGWVENGDAASGRRGTRGQRRSRPAPFCGDGRRRRGSRPRCPCIAGTRAPSALAGEWISAVAPWIGGACDRRVHGTGAEGARDGTRARRRAAVPRVRCGAEPAAGPAIKAGVLRPAPGVAAVPVLQADGRGGRAG